MYVVSIEILDLSIETSTCQFCHLLLPSPSAAFL